MKDGLMMRGRFSAASNGKWWTGLALVALLGGCATTPQEPPLTLADIEAEKNGESLEGIALLYEETEAGTHRPFATRIFINRLFMHISDSRSPADYILFDRKKQVIYSVNTEDETIFEIHKKSIDIDPPIPLNYVEVSQPSNAIPKIDGRSATYFSYTANGKKCYNAVVTHETFMPDVRKAMKNYRSILAAEHASTLAGTPLDMLDACDLAVNIFEANRHYAVGLPIREWGNGGYQRFLKDYQFGLRVSQKVLTLPENYRHYSLDQPLSVVPEAAAGS